MENKKVAKELVKLAKKMVSYTPSSNPTKVIKDMRNAGVAMGYDGTVYTYPLTEGGLPILTAKPNKTIDVDAAIRQTEYVMKNTKDAIKLYDKFLNTISTFKKLLKQDVVDAEMFEKEIMPFYRPRVKREDKKEINTVILGLQEAVKGSQAFQVERELANITTVVEEYISNLKSIIDTWKERRKLLINMKNVFKKEPMLLKEVATEGSPADFKMKEPRGEMETPKSFTKIDGLKDDVPRKIQKAIKNKEALQFEYRKKSGRNRIVKLMPEEIKGSGDKMMVKGYDYDRQDDRNFYMEMIL